MLEHDLPVGETERAGGADVFEIAAAEKLGSDKLSWDMTLPVQPVAMPGRTKFS